MNGQPDNYEGRQDFGDGEGSLIQHIQNYHEYYAKDENWKNFVLHNKGPEAWEHDKAEREMVLTEFIPYLKQHCNLSAMEQTATTALREGQNISPEQAAYYNAVVAYVQDCRPLLNQGQYNLPEPPKLADFDQSLQNYKAATSIGRQAWLVEPLWALSPPTVLWALWPDWSYWQLSYLLHLDYILFHFYILSSKPQIILFPPYL